MIAHHGIFHFNRLGLAAQDQHTLSTLAKEVVMGTSDNAASTQAEGAPGATVNGVNSDTIEAPSADRLRAQLIDHLVETGCVRTPRVEEAMRTVPRHLFVPNAPLEKAYGNAPVDTKFDGSGRSISCASQPDIVAMMLEQLDVQPGQKILELGAGTGFNAGLLGYLVGETGHVTTIDVDEDIVAGARGGLAAAGIHNVEVILGDGAVGHTPTRRTTASKPPSAPTASRTPGSTSSPLADAPHPAAPARQRLPLDRLLRTRTEPGAASQSDEHVHASAPGHRRRPAPLRTPGPRPHRHPRHQRRPEGRRGRLGDIFRQPRTEAWTDVTFRGPESAEYLELWLTCAMPNGLSRMPAKNEAIEKGLVTAPYPSSTAVFEDGTLTYLTRARTRRRPPTAPPCTSSVSSATAPTPRPRRGRRGPDPRLGPGLPSARRWLRDSAARRGPARAEARPLRLRQPAEPHRHRMAVTWTSAR